MGKNPTILLVDDFANNLDILEVYLRRAYNGKVEIHRALTGKEALECFEQHTLDLVLLDVMLPDMDGFQICSYMKKARGDDFLPIVMLTALHDKESLLEGLSVGADDFLPKPVNSDELMIRVRNLLNLRFTHRELQWKYEQLSHEMHMARELLNDFMPKYSPSVEGVQIETIYEPSSILGGDFYDVFTIDAENYGIFISDVKGHGAAAAMIVALIKENLYHLKVYWSKPDKLMQRMNAIMYHFFENIRNDYFVTAIYGVFNFKKKTFKWVNAGHTPVAYFQKEFFRELEGGGLPLGIFGTTEYQVLEQPFNSREGFLFYTDGLFELPMFANESEHYSSLEETHIIQSGGCHEARQFMEKVRQNIEPSSLVDDVNLVGVFIGGANHE